MKIHNNQFQPQNKKLADNRKLPPSLKPTTPTLQQLLNKQTSPTARDTNLSAK